MYVVIDTREKTPWQFTKSVSGKLNAGDYSLEGHENEIAIERKATVAEIAQNFCKSHFWRAMEKLAELPQSFLVCEFPLSDLYMYPNVNCLPPAVRRKTKISSAFIRSKYLQLVELDIQVVFAGDAYFAKKAATDIFKRFLKYGPPKTS